MAEQLRLQERPPTDHFSFISRHDLKVTLKGAN